MKILSFFTLSITLASCGPKNCIQYFAFEFPMSVTSTDTFNLGDTIWHEMRLPQTMLDKNSGEYINLDQFNLYFKVSIDRWDSNQVVSAILDFTIVQDVGTITQHTNLFTFTFLEFEDIEKKNLRFGLVPRVAGKFGAAISFPQAYYEQEELTARDPERLRITGSPCRQVMTTQSTITINQGDINHYLVENLCQPSYFSGDTFCINPYEVLVERGYYAFVVR